MVTPLEEGGIEEAIYAYNNIILSDSTPRKVLSPQLKKISARYKLMNGCEDCISVKSMHSYLLS